MKRSIALPNWPHIFRLRLSTLLVLMTLFAFVAWFCAASVHQEQERASVLISDSPKQYTIALQLDSSLPSTLPLLSQRRRMAAYLMRSQTPRTANQIKITGSAPASRVIRCMQLYPELQCLDVDAATLDSSLVEQAKQLAHLKYFRIRGGNGNHQLLPLLAQLPARVEIQYSDVTLNKEFVDALVSSNAHVTYIGYNSHTLRFRQLDTLIGLPHLKTLKCICTLQPDNFIAYAPQNYFDLEIDLMIDSQHFIEICKTKGQIRLTEVIIN